MSLLNGFDSIAKAFEEFCVTKSRELKSKSLDTKSSFSRPIKALDVFSRNLKEDFLTLLKNRNLPEGNYHAGKCLTAEQFADEIVEYVKNLVLTNNDYDNWIYQT